MWRTVLVRVFGKGRYALLIVILFCITVSLVLLLPNASLIAQVIANSDVSAADKLILIGALYGSVITNHTLLSASMMLSLVVLFAINISLLVFYIRRAQKLSGGTRVQATSLAGVVSGIFGIGCAACGSVILTSVAASVGATSLLVTLPLHGGEFAFLGMIFLLASIIFLVKKIHDPLVCPAKY